MIITNLSGKSSAYGLFLDGKWYVGKTDRNPEERWDNGKGYPANAEMTAAIERVGWDNVPKVIFAQDVAPWVASLVERYTIAEKRALYPNGYNLTTGGDKGYHMAKITRERMSAAHKKPIAQLDSDTGEVLNVWESALDAEKALQIHACDISLVVHGKRKTAGKYGWKRFDDITAAGENPAAFLIESEGEGLDILQNG